MDTPAGDRCSDRAPDSQGRPTRGDQRSLTPARPSTTRAHNDRLALDLLCDNGPLTAGQLVSLTGLSRPTVAELLRRLQEARLIRPIGEADTVRRGPNAKVYALAADQAHVAGLDVRTDGVTVAVADLVGETVATRHVDAATDGGIVGRVLAALDATVRRVGSTGPRAVAIGAPGRVDPLTGRLSPTGVRSGWHTDLIQALGECGYPVIVENEVNLAASAEHRIGAARGADTFALLWLGHGVGAAMVVEGQLWHGVSGGAGELGFLPVPGTGGLPSATACGGGFHSLASTAAVLALAGEYDLIGSGPGRGPSAGDVVRSALADGGAPGAAFLDVLARRVALGVCGVCVILDPGLIVLGGEIGQAGGPALADLVSHEVARLSPLRCEVRASTLSDGAVLRGAVHIALAVAHAELFPPASAASG